MKILQVRVQDFRNIGFVELECAGVRQFFLGRNGQGKTNMLEAMGLISALRSFRTKDIRPLIRQGAAEAQVHLRIEHDQQGERELHLTLTPGSRQVLLDGEKCGLAELLGLFPTVVLSTDDAQLLRGAPGLRRRFLDLTLSSISRSYFNSLRQYHRALRERNSLLKQPKPPASQLDFYENAMAQAAAVLCQERQASMAEIERLLQEKYDCISGGAPEQPGLRYSTRLGEADEETLRALWGANRERDLRAGMTTTGPHRDELEFRVKGGDAQDMGSEGQQRGLAVALRLAQASLFRKHLGVAPVLLVDDVLGEFDAQRRAGFWAALDDAQQQVVATGTQLPEDPAQWQVYEVSDGTFSEPFHAGAD